MRSLVGVVAVVALFALFAGWLREKVDISVMHDGDRLITQLDNGLIIITQRIDTAPVVSVQCWIKTGSIYEQEHNGAGLSHFLEHLVSGGTTTNRKEEVSSRLLGEMGAQTNAATSLDTVRYYINTTSDHAPKAIDLMSDWMRNSVITQAEYERERDVIQREFDMGRGDPNRIFWMATQQARYSTHPARHPIIGYLDEFLSVSRDEIYDFYKRMYVPNNMVFIVTGDIDPEAVTAQVTELWADAERGDLPDLKFPVKDDGGAVRDVTAHADVRLPRLRLVWPGVGLGSEHDYALDLLSTVLGDGELSRLVKSIRNEQKLVTRIDAYNWSVTWGQGFFSVDAVASPATLDKVKPAVLDQIQRVRDEGVTEAELNRAKAKTLAAVVFAAQTAEGMASRLARDVIGTGNPDYLQHYAQAIQKVSVQDIKAAANAVLDDDQLITARLLPKGGKMPYPTRPDDAGPAGKQVPFDLDNDVVMNKLRANRRPRADADEKTIEPMRIVTLDNGLRVIVQRDSRLPIVAMQWYHLGGLLADNAGREGVANAMTSMMMKGAGGKTADQIAAQLGDIGARLGTSCGSNTFYANAQCLSKDWQTVMGIMGDVIVRPDFPEDQWKLMRPRLLASIDSARDRWSSEMMLAFHERYFGDHPWSQPTVGRRNVVESIDHLALKRFHRDHIAAPQGIVAVVGDVDADQVIEMARQCFGDLPMQAAKTFVPPKQEKVAKGIVQVETGKPLCAVQIGYGPGLTRNSDDYAAMLVMTRVVSNFPSGWVQKALRGDGPGLVYASWAFNRVGVVPGYWAMAFNTSPDTAPLAINRCLEIVERLKTETISDEELTRARAAVRTGESMQGQAYSDRASRAALDELYGVGFGDDDRLLRQIEQVEAQQIQSLARQYLGEPFMLLLTNKPVDESQIKQP
jgi:zinc protease